MISLSNLTAGLVAVLVSFTSSVAIIFQAAAATGATSLEVSSWILALGLGMGVTCIGLSLYYRIPILTAWSTPGAALLVTSLAHVSLPDAIGAFLFSAMLIFLSGITGFFEKWRRCIPRSLAAAILAGVLFHFGLNIFMALQTEWLLVLGMFIVYLIGKRLFPSFVILLTLGFGMLIAALKGLIHLQHFHFVWSQPVFILPHFSMPVLLSIGIPLFIVTMTAQNIPGIAAIEAAHYQVPVSSILTWTGLTNFILAPFGGFAFNLAAITAAICLSHEADPHRNQRYKASVCAGVFYCITGLLGATVVALFAAFPIDLIVTIAGLALLGTIGNSLKTALDHPREREPALIAFLVTASGMSLWGMGSAFWGLVVGVLVFLSFSVNKAHKQESLDTLTK